jgi:hypothetical protein
MVIRVFVANCSKDLSFVESKIIELSNLSPELIVIQEKINSPIWKSKVVDKLEKSDFFIVMLGEGTLKNSNIRWEMEQARSLGVIICGVKLDNITKNEEVRNFSMEFPLFENVDKLYTYFQSEMVELKKTRLESYKIFVGSTEKVTDQRSKIHTLFFTLLASLMTLSFLIAKAKNFDESSVIAIILLAFVALFLIQSWKKLVDSYGVLNKGKFEIVYKLEKQLGINYFEQEWKILVDKLKYQSNTETEKQIINIFRLFLTIVVVFSLVYLIYLKYKSWTLTL